MPSECLPACSLCCRYVAIPIDPPTSRSSIEQMRWMVSHKDVWLYADDEGEWFVQFITPCEELDLVRNRCGIYEDRFSVCRLHGVASCEATLGEGTEARFFRSLREFDAYLESRRARRAG